MQQEHITEKARAEETVLTLQKPGSCWSAGPSLRFTVMLKTWGHTQQSEQEQDEDIVAQRYRKKKCISTSGSFSFCSWFITACSVLTCFPLTRIYNIIWKLLQENKG